MKKIIIFLLIIFNSIGIYAENNIPGFLELDLNYSYLINFYDQENKPKLAFTKIEIKYGEEFNWFQPTELYGFASWQTFFEVENIKKNCPYRDIYGCGLGIKIRIFYFEYEHRCSHAVFHGGNNAWDFKVGEVNYLQFEGMPTLSYDSFKVGIKLRID